MQNPLTPRLFGTFDEGYMMATADEMYDAANALKEQGDLEGAVVKLGEILETDPNHVLTHQALGVHLQKLGQSEDSIKHATKVTELEPDDPFSWTQLSVIFQRNGRIPEAEEAMARAHEIQAGQGPTH